MAEAMLPKSAVSNAAACTTRRAGSTSNSTSPAFTTLPRHGVGRNLTPDGGYQNFSPHAARYGGQPLWARLWPQRVSNVFRRYSAFQLLHLVIRLALSSAVWAT